MTINFVAGYGAASFFNNVALIGSDSYLNFWCGAQAASVMTRTRAMEKEKRLGQFFIRFLNGTAFYLSIPIQIWLTIRARAVSYLPTHAANLLFAVMVLYSCVSSLTLQDVPAIGKHHDYGQPCNNKPNTDTM